MARDYPKNQKQSDNIFNRDTNPQTRMTGRCTKCPPWTVALLPVSLSATYLGAALREIGMCGGEPAGTVRTSRPGWSYHAIQRLNKSNVRENTA
jgi:hypothetical protein